MATQFALNFSLVGSHNILQKYCSRPQRVSVVRRAANPQQQQRQHVAETVALQSEASSPAAYSSAPQPLQELVEDVQHLEQSFLQPSAAPSPEPAAAAPVVAASSAAAIAAGSAASVAAGPAISPDVLDSNALRTQLRSTYIRQALPLRRTVRTAERKLGAELSAVGFAIVLMVAVIMYDRGWNNLLDRLDDSLLGDVCCMIAGLGMVTGVRLMGWQPKDYFNV